MIVSTGEKYSSTQDFMYAIFVCCSPHVAEGFGQFVNVQEPRPVFIQAREHAAKLRRAVPVFRHFVEGFVHR